MKKFIPSFLSFIRKYSLFLFILNLVFWTSLSSTNIQEIFRFSATTCRILSLFLYLPFGAVFIWKIIDDIRGFKKTPINLLFYLFVFYYIILSAVRFFLHFEVKENAYFIITLLGSIALYCQLADHRLSLSMDEIKKNFVYILSFTCIYKAIFTVFSTGMFGVPRVFGNPPINNLYSTSVLVLSLPFLIDLIKEQKRFSASSFLLLLGSLILIALCNSRAIFILAMLIFFILVIINIKQPALILNCLSAFLCMVLIVGTMAFCKVKTVDYSLNRVLGPLISLEESVEEGPSFEEPSTSPSQMQTSPTQEPTSDSIPGDETSDEQIKKSDSMRSDLLKQGINEAKKNIFFGTGDLFYSYDMGYKVMEQTAHNFIVETLVSVGLIGFLLIALIVLTILINGNFFKGIFSLGYQTKIAAFLSIIFYFAFGMVQPSVYNTLVCPIFFFVVYYFARCFSTEKKLS